MNEPLATLWNVVDESQIEHIELSTSPFVLSDPFRLSETHDRRASNRVVWPRVAGQLLVKQPFLGWWSRTRYFPCRIIDLSLDGVRIDSPLRIGEGETLELKLRGDQRREVQILPLRIVCHREPQDGTYGYGAAFKEHLAQPFRRLIIARLTH